MNDKDYPSNSLNLPQAWVIPLRYYGLADHVRLVAYARTDGGLQRIAEAVGTSVEEVRRALAPLFERHPMVADGVEPFGAGGWIPDDDAETPAGFVAPASATDATDFPTPDEDGPR